MGLIILLIVGGVIGWLASLVMRTDGQQGILLNVVVGIVGALLAGFILNPLIGGGNIIGSTCRASAGRTGRGSIAQRVVRVTTRRHARTTHRSERN